MFLALLQPGDIFMGLDLSAGGHLTHGSPVNMSGKWFKVASYGVRREDQLLDYEEIARVAREQTRPKLIICRRHGLLTPDLGLPPLPRDLRTRLALI